MAAAPRGTTGLPCAEPRAAVVETPDDAAIAAQPICIASTVRSAGELGPALLYRSARLVDGRIAVGYYAFFSEERPWGNNWLTWSVVPALAVDAVYTRLLFVAPGVQRAEYGPADVEGFCVIYTVGPDGRLVPERALADDDGHHLAELGIAELLAADPTRITLATNTWSHHLGARVRRPSDVVYRRCYEAGSIQPVTEDIARRFNLARRAWPARLGAG
ncbi:Hypothetical protein A7982_03504 [Minicystis rosea]|nr:Hypothetical protein A7982_03504 [Minicystis rosea]